MPPDEEFISGTGLGFGMSAGPIGIDFYNRWYGGRVDPDRFFVFVGNRNLVDRDYRRFVVPRDRVKIVLGRTRPATKFEVVNNHVVNRGIDLRIIERATGRKIAPVSAKVVIKPNAVITSVSEAKEIRQRERVAHPIDVKAARRAASGDKSTPDAATPNGGKAAGDNQPNTTGEGDDTRRGRKNNPSGAPGQDNGASDTTTPASGADTSSGEKAGGGARTRAPSGDSTSAPPDKGANPKRTRAPGADTGTNGSGDAGTGGGGNGADQTGPTSPAGSDASGQPGRRSGPARTPGSDSGNASSGTQSDAPASHPPRRLGGSSGNANGSNATGGSGTGSGSRNRSGHRPGQQR